VGSIVFQLRAEHWMVWLSTNVSFVCKHSCVYVMFISCFNMEV